jgi:hypothetical protein
MELLDKMRGGKKTKIGERDIKEWRQAGGSCIALMVLSINSCISF